jgi:hypothetical protein
LHQYSAKYEDTAALIYLIDAEVTCSSSLFEFEERYRAKWHQAAAWPLMIGRSSCVENTSCRLDNPKPDIVALISAF